MVYLIITLLVGVNISSFVMPSIYLWTAHQIFCQGMIATILAYMIFQKTEKIQIGNLPLMLLTLWIVMSSTFISHRTLSKVFKYNMVNYITYFNFLLIIIFYKAVLTLTRKEIEKIIVVLKYIVIVTVFLTVLQIIGLSQFFKLLGKEGTNFRDFHNNLAVGFIGNGTHLSGFLGTCIPIFLYYGKREDWMMIGLIFVVMCFTGTTLGDPAISGFIISLFVIGYWYYRNKLVFIPYIITIGAITATVIFKSPGRLLSSNGRISAWKHYFILFKMAPITGQGLGAINMLSGNVAKTDWNNHFLVNLRHLHMELFHFIFELGIVGGVLIVNVIKEFINVPVRDNVYKLFKCMVLSFFVSSCFNYPAHLWIPSLFAMFAYATIYNLENKELTYDL